MFEHDIHFNGFRCWEPYYGIFFIFSPAFFVTLFSDGENTPVQPDQIETQHIEASLRTIDVRYYLVRKNYGNK